MTRTEIYRSAGAQMDSAARKHGTRWVGMPALSDLFRLAVLVEEICEVQEAMMEKRWGDVPNEVIQVMAVCLSWRGALKIPDRKHLKKCRDGNEMMLGMLDITRAIQANDRVKLKRGLWWVESAAINYLEAQ